MRAEWWLGVEVRKLPFGLLVLRMPYVFGCPKLTSSADPEVAISILADPEGKYKLSWACCGEVARSEVSTFSGGLTGGFLRIPGPARDI